VTTRGGENRTDVLENVNIPRHGWRYRTSPVGVAARRKNTLVKGLQKAKNEYYFLKLCNIRGNGRRISHDRKQITPGGKTGENAGDYKIMVLCVF